MQIRHALLAAAVVAAGLAAGGATVLADDGAPRRELHVIRVHDRAAIDRIATMQRLDRLLAGIDDIAARTQAYPSRGRVGYLRADDADHAERERHGAEPLRSGELRHVPPAVAARIVRERLDGMRRELLALRSSVLRAPRIAPAPRVLLPMDARAFRRFVYEVRRAPFAEDRVAVVADVARHARFTSAQVAIVVRAIQSWGRVDAAVHLYPRVIDPERFYVAVQGALSFSSDRTELRRRIGR